MAATDPGAVYKGRREKDDNLALAMAVGEILKTELMFYIQEPKMIYMTPFERARLANQARWIFLSLFTGTAALKVISIMA